MSGFSGIAYLRGVRKRKCVDPVTIHGAIAPPTVPSQIGLSSGRTAIFVRSVCRNRKLGKVPHKAIGSLHLRTCRCTCIRARSSRG